MKLGTSFILAGGLAAAISAAEPAEARNKFGFLGRTFGAPTIKPMIWMESCLVRQARKLRAGFVL